MSDAKVIPFPKTGETSRYQSGETFASETTNETRENANRPQLPDSVIAHVDHFVETTLRSLERLKNETAQVQQKKEANNAFNDDLGVLLNPVYKQTQQDLCFSVFSEDDVYDTASYLCNYAYNYLSNGGELGHVLQCIQDFTRDFAKRSQTVAPMHVSRKNYQ